MIEDMPSYGPSDLLRLAKRHHNTRREYLLVDPLQGKHLPVSPTAALAMMGALGARMARQRPGIDLVIGFAETATAVAAAAAAAMGRPCRYIHTTREPSGGEVLEFQEEHSHAVEQLLRMERLGPWIAEASAVALVDDELSTGKTMVNAIGTLAGACPALRRVPLTVASVISRLTDRRRAALSEIGDMRFVSLLDLPEADYAAAVRRYEISPASRPLGPALPWEEARLSPGRYDARDGVWLPDWTDALAAASDTLLARLAGRLEGRRVTVLGTEEYMLPGLVLGARLEASGVAGRVRFHATTRSPIGVCHDADYPIRSGWRLRSFYDPSRVTYIYDLAPCDVALIVTDSRDDGAVAPAMEDLTAALGEAGCGEALLIREG